MIHGGDIYRNEVKIDYSVSINPMGPLDSVIDIAKIAVSNMFSYPDIENEKLCKKLSAYHKVDKDLIAIGNGASEIFMAIASSLRPKGALLPVPSFNGYKRVLDANRVKVNHFLLKTFDNFKLGLEIQDMINKDTGILFLSNPNNPTGTYINREVLISIVGKCKEKGVIVVLDESNIELSDDPDNNTLIKDAVEFGNLFVVRSLSNSYAMPGLRLGYVVCGDPKKVSLLKDHLPEWNISLPAQLAGLAALADKDYLKKSREMIKKEKLFLTLGLTNLGIEVYKSNANYLLIYSEKELYWALLRKGILIRDCSDFMGLTRGFFRIGIKDRESNTTLLNEIKNVV